MTVSRMLSYLCFLSLVKFILSIFFLFCLPLYGEIKICIIKLLQPVYTCTPLDGSKIVMRPTLATM